MKGIALAGKFHYNEGDAEECGICALPALGYEKDGGLLNDGTEISYFGSGGHPQGIADLERDG